ncbi:MAG TPA: hypothetical protein VN937_05475 [Blastocatellia bacterium]|nr:hypothetical protein [Blastocatellia bacterium]
MRSSKTVLQRSSVPVILLIVCLLGLGIGGVSLKSQKSTGIQSNTPRIQNRTRSFEVVQVSPSVGENGEVELSLRNRYSKNITACAVSVNGSITEVDFAFSELEDQRGLSPESVYEQKYSFARRVNKSAARQNLDISILAVVFDDKTGDGDPKFVTEILDTRLGSKIQLTRIIALLNDALNLPRVPYEAVDTLKARISSLPVDSANSTSETAREGLRNQKSDALRRLESQTSLNPQERIRTLKDIYESLAARL